MVTVTNEETRLYRGERHDTWRNVEREDELIERANMSERNRAKYIDVELLRHTEGHGMSLVRRIITA